MTDPNITQLKSKDLPEFREMLLKQQGGVCLICKKVPKRACVDHSHTKRTKGTGLVRGVLDSNMNVLLAKSENNCVRYGISQKDLPTILRNMADYLERDHLPYMHPSEAPPIPKLMKSSYKELFRAYRKNLIRSPFPPFPKSGKMTVGLAKLYEYYDIEPRFYK